MYPDYLLLVNDQKKWVLEAKITTQCIPSFVSLSQSRVFRRQWSSIYAALHDSRPPTRKLMKLLVQEVKTSET
ncbi:MAG: hypothetical protein ACLBM1_14510 [Cuspidothrix sp.]|jgi:hypothetical protein